jgi:glycolate oxidase iron-sulfur subunit
VPHNNNPAFHGPDLPPPALIDKCVHCGFCLPTCPTYVLWGEEMDSPRGRIYLMKAGVDGRAALTDGMVRHFDRCLGCLACVTACPSGVEYGPLIEKTRAQIERHHERGARDRLFRTLLMSLIPYPSRMRVAMLPLALAGGIVRALGRAWSASPAPSRETAARREAALARRGEVSEAPPYVSGTRASHQNAPSTSSQDDGPRKMPPSGETGLLKRIAAAMALSPPVDWRGLFGTIPEMTAPSGSSRLDVAVLTGCVQRLAFAEVNRATVRVLAAEGCTVRAPARQGCCGALPLHAGEIEQARALARYNIEVFEAAGVERIVVNAAGCGSAMKEYGELLGGDPHWAARARDFSARVRDVSEVLVELGETRAPRQPIAARVVYHDACHLAHGQGVRAQPRALLQAIPGLELLTPVESEICCGSAGIYNLIEPEPAAQLGARKVRNIAALAPDLIATGNPGCTLQIAAAARVFGYNWPILHPIQLVDASIRGVELANCRPKG